MLYWLVRITCLRSWILVSVSGALGLAGCGGHVQTASYDSYSEADTDDYSAGRTRIEALNEDGKREITNEQNLPSPGWSARQAAW